MALNCDPEVRRHMNGPMTELAAGQRFDGMLAEDSADRSFCWAIVEKETSTFVGHAFLQMVDHHTFPELGFLFFKSFWGRGYATEVARRLVEHCLSDCDFRGLSATVDCDHAPSIRVLEKAGFKERRVATDEFGPFFCLFDSTLEFKTTHSRQMLRYVGGSTWGVWQQLCGFLPPHGDQGGLSWCVGIV